jgi:RHS repeat-associated protein
LAAGALLARYTGDSNSRSFVPFKGRLLAEYYCGGMIFDHPDEIGSATTATDCTGKNVQERLYYPFGEFWNGAGSLGMRQMFAQLPDYDPETDQYNTANRHYTPMGRWLSPDPLGGDVTNPQSLNRYAYVLNNPTTLVDPLGLQNCRPPWTERGSGVCVGNVLQITSAEMGWGLVGGYSAWDEFGLMLYTVCPGNGELCGTGFDFGGAAVANLLATSRGNALAILPLRPPLGAKMMASLLPPEVCGGEARVLYSGNPKLFGRPTAFGQEATTQTAAIIPSQFGGYGQLRPFASQISGWGWQSPSPNPAFTFQGLDAVGPVTPTFNAQSYLQRQYPGQFIMELEGGSGDLGSMWVFLDMPGNLPCPAGTQLVSY